MYRAIDLLLLVAAIVGGVLAWRSDGECRRLRKEYDRLCQLTGELEIKDPSKVHVKAIDTGEPLHFAWHCYFPPNTKMQWSTGSGGSSSWSSQAVQCIVRVRFHKDKSGEMRVYQKYHGGSSFGSLHVGSAFERPEELEIEQLGTDKLVTFSPNESIVFLKLTATEDLQKKVPKYLRKSRVFPVLYQLKFGMSPTAP